ncbi:hypothetical protein CBS63078_936 [Aspergillus niger]|nr:hypothetical protein CBS63078_936 [Aspergillus niger]
MIVSRLSGNQLGIGGTQASNLHLYSVVSPIRSSGLTKPPPNWLGLVLWQSLGLKARRNPWLEVHDDPLLAERRPTVAPR